MPMKKVKKGSNMYDWVSHVHSFIGGECSHKCKYCLDGETNILMGDGSCKNIKDINIGDKSE